MLGEIKGTPTIRLFKPKTKKNRYNRKKIVLDYNGERKKKDMKRFVEANIPNFLEKVHDLKGLEKFQLKANKYGLPQALVFSKKGTTSALLKYASAEYRRRLLIGEVKMTKKNKAVMDKFSVDGAKTAIVVVKGDEVVPYTKNGFSFHKVVNFLGKHALKEAVSGKKKKEEEKTPASDSENKEEM